MNIKEYNKYLFIFAVILFSLTFGMSLVSADTSFIFKQNTAIDLKVPVLNNDNSLVDFSTSCNLTTRYPNDNIVVQGASMTFNVNYFNYTFNNTALNALGEYSNSITCTDGIDFGFSSFTFLITPTGTDPSISQGIIYFAILIVSIVLFVVVLWGSIALPFSNEKDSYGGILAINYKKYTKIILFFVSYLLLLWISWTAWNISQGFFFIDAGTNFFKTIFYTLLTILLPLFIGFVIFIIVVAIQDLKLEKLAKRGLSPR